MAGRSTALVQMTLLSKKWNPPAYNHKKNKKKMAVNMDRRGLQNTRQIWEIFNPNTKLQIEF